MKVTAISLLYISLIFLLTQCNTGSKVHNTPCPALNIAMSQPCNAIIGVPMAPFEKPIKTDGEVDLQEYKYEYQ